MRVLEIAVQPDIASVISYYDKLKVFKSATYAGTYTEIAASPVSLVSGQTIYTVVDNAGLASDFYRFSYFKTTGSVESDRYNLPVNYCTVAALKGRLNEITTGDDSNFFDAVAAATDAIYRYCGRKFYQLTETRYFEGSSSKGFYLGKGSQVLSVDDFVSISAITANYPGGQTSINATTAVNWLPDNAPAIDWPYTALALVPTTGIYWPSTYRGVAITGSWGWPINMVTQSPVPAAVRESALQIAARIYQGKSNAYGHSIGQSDLGTESVDDALMSKDVMALLEPYRKR